MPPDDCRRYAAECLKIAESISDQRSRGVFKAMAVSWMRLAEQAEKNLQTVLVYQTPEPRQHIDPEKGE